MNVASRELCQELYEMSGWDSSLAGGNARWCLLGGEQWELLRLSDAEAYQPVFTKEWFAGVPAYDLGYLLRKLPRYIDEDLRLTIQPTNVDQWCAGYDWLGEDRSRHNCFSDNPEDAACSLAITLFKNGVSSHEK